MHSEDGRHSVDLRFETSQAGRKGEPGGLEESMGTSLFEREKLGAVGGPSKAMNMMVKMGFK